MICGKKHPFFPTKSTTVAHQIKLPLLRIRAEDTHPIANGLSIVRTRATFGSFTTAAREMLPVVR
jgi:hypothetical protein